MMATSLTQTLTKGAIGANVNKEIQGGVQEHAHVGEESRTGVLGNEFRNEGGHL